MAYKLGSRSLKNLEGVHPDLVSVVKLAIQRTEIDFTVIDGVRTIAEQKSLVSNGDSTTMNSRHLTGHAVDIVPLNDGKVSWHWPLYYELEKVIKKAAADLNVPIEWGGDWTSFKDGPHWQLPWSEYGKTDLAPRVKTPAKDYAPLPVKETRGFIEFLRLFFGIK